MGAGALELAQLPTDDIFEQKNVNNLKDGPARMKSCRGHTSSM